MNDNYEDELRQRILKKIDNLRSKIESNEPLPESEQDVSFLVYISDCVDEALNSWYY